MMFLRFCYANASAKGKAKSKKSAHVDFVVILTYLVTCVELVFDFSLHYICVLFSDSRFSLRKFTRDKLLT